MFALLLKLPLLYKEYTMIIIKETVVYAIFKYIHMYANSHQVIMYYWGSLCHCVKVVPLQERIQEGLTVMISVLPSLAPIVEDYVQAMRVWSWPFIKLRTSSEVEENVFERSLMDCWLYWKVFHVLFLPLFLSFAKETGTYMFPLFCVVLSKILWE